MVADRLDKLQRGIKPATAVVRVHEIQAVSHGAAALKAEIGRDSRLLGRLLKNAAGGYRLELHGVLRVVYHFKYRVGKIRGAQPVHDDIADAYLGASLGSGYEWWHNFYEFHKLAIDELEAFDYEEYKKNGFKLKHLGDYPLKLETKPEE